MIQRIINGNTGTSIENLFLYLVQLKISQPGIAGGIVSVRCSIRLQNSPYFCVFKYARAVKQKVWNEAENRERDWGGFFLSPHTRVRLALVARVRLLRHALTISLLILRKKPTVLQSSARLKFYRRRRGLKKGVGTRGVCIPFSISIFYFSQLTPLMTALPPNLTLLLHNTASYAG